MTMLRRLAPLALLGILACHEVNGPCCSNSECPNSAICSVTSCAANGAGKGTCLSPCAVDADCNAGEVCNVIILNCGCQQIDAGEFPNLNATDAGIDGTCSGNVGH